MKTNRVTIEGVEMTVEAARAIEHAGISPSFDVSAIRSGEMTPRRLLDACLDGADESHDQGWRDYVLAVEVAAGG